ncbi:MAG: hypothetical protein JJU05_11725 [Verrucomicrobia bacterium]|nr:hypothetical protein [Verrucomicrobiota bacterium]MCH8528049.1 hypothetical protein [Kiritimatiellia bacterium]
MSSSAFKSKDTEAEIEVGPLTPGQAKLIQFLRSLDKNYRHSFTLICNGAEPAKIEEVMEHRDIDLRL